MGTGMTTGQKLAALRRKGGITQEQIAESLGVSRQAVSRWEMDAAFPETEKLIRLSRILGCSVDFLLKTEEQAQEREVGAEGSVPDCLGFIRQCGYFFLATSVRDVPKLRPMGFIHTDGKFLYIATDRKKQVCSDLAQNPRMEIASYNLNSRRWIRIGGTAQEEKSSAVREEMEAANPMLRQEFPGGEQDRLVVFRVRVESVRID